MGEKFAVVMKERYWSIVVTALESMCNFQQFIKEEFSPDLILNRVTDQVKDKAGLISIILTKKEWKVIVKFVANTLDNFKSYVSKEGKRTKLLNCLEEEELLIQAQRDFEYVIETICHSVKIDLKSLEITRNRLLFN